MRPSSGDSVRTNHVYTRVGKLMRQAALIATGTFAVTERPGPSIGDRCLLIPVHYCRGCMGELGVWSKTLDNGYPQCIGHEISGVIAIVGCTSSAFTARHRVMAITGGNGYPTLSEQLKANSLRCLIPSATGYLWGTVGVLGKRSGDLCNWCRDSSPVRRRSHLSLNKLRTFYLVLSRIPGKNLGCTWPMIWSGFAERSSSTAITKRVYDR